MSAYFALVAAAGSGARMAAATPKQYRTLAGRPLLYHALDALCGSADIARVFVVLAVDDGEWSRHDWVGLGEKLVPLFCGGATRAQSVANGLRAIAEFVTPQDWVLVHDAARPCLTRDHVRKLIREVADDDVGGILAAPLADTLKRAQAREPRVAATLARDGLWQAQTPQMFRYRLLRHALEQGVEVTDEASAVERLGLMPKLVVGDISNLKVTYPLDLHLAELILNDRKE